MFHLNFTFIRFALVKVKFAFATIIKDFKVTLDDSKTILPLSFNPKAVTIEPKGGFYVKYERI